MRRLVVHLIFGVSALVTSAKLYAAWMPEQSLKEFAFLDRLQAPGYLQLKSQVQAALQGSWCSSEKMHLLMDLVLITRPQVCVEVGVFSGSSVLPVASVLKFNHSGTLYAIDAWSNDLAVQYLPWSDPNRPWWATINMNDIEAMYNQMLQSWQLLKVCTTIKTTSATAADFVTDIDFLHLDGDYSEEGAIQDVRFYLPKVKSGGYILFSGLYTCVNNYLPKKKAFCLLFDSGECDFVCEIERAHAVLLRKI